MIQPKNANVILSEKGGGNASVSVNNFYLYLKEQDSKKIRPFDLTGLKKWLTSFINAIDKNKNIEVTTTTDVKISVPKYSYVHCIRLEGTATGITVTFDGKAMDVTDCASGKEIQPRKQYCTSDQTLTVSATSWGKLNIIVIKT